MGGIERATKLKVFGIWFELCALYLGCPILASVKAWESRMGGPKGQYVGNLTIVSNWANGQLSSSKS